MASTHPRYVLSKLAVIFFDYSQCDKPDDWNEDARRDVLKRLQVPMLASTALDVRLRPDVGRQVQAPGFSFVKTLGCGSQGIAALFEMQAKNGGWREIIIKYSDENTDDDMSREMNVMRNMAAARHVLQRLYISGLDVQDAFTSHAKASSLTPNERSQQSNMFMAGINLPDAFVDGTDTFTGGSAPGFVCHVSYVARQPR